MMPRSGLPPSAAVKRAAGRVLLIVLRVAEPTADVVPQEGLYVVGEEDVAATVAFGEEPTLDDLGSPGRVRLAARLPELHRAPPRGAAIRWYNE